MSGEESRGRTLHATAPDSQYYRPLYGYAGAFVCLTIGLVLHFAGIGWSVWIIVAAWPCLLYQATQPVRKYAE